MKLQHIVYLHPRERFSIVALLAMIFIYCFGEKKIIHWLMENQMETSVYTNVKKDANEEPARCYDINKVDKSELMALGLNETIAGRWLNYRQAVEGFTSLSQIHKIYGLSENAINQIIPYLTIVLDESPKAKSTSSINTPNITNREAAIVTYEAPAEAKKQPPSEKTSRTQPEKKPIQPFCINSADAKDFTVIRGIGKVLSTRIVRYRDLLGGFHSPEQLVEVYGIEEEIIANNLSFFIIQNTVMELIDWREAEFKEILSHPYTEYDEVICVVNKIKTETTLKDLKECFQPEVWKKLKPYLIE